MSGEDEGRGEGGQEEGDAGRKKEAEGKKEAHGRTAKKALKTILEINPSCKSFTADLTESENLPSFYDEVSTAMGGIDLLFNNAGNNAEGERMKLIWKDGSISTNSIRQLRLFFLSALPGKE